MTAKFDSAIVVSESLEEAEDFLKIAVFCLMAISPFFLMLCFVFEGHLIQMFGITVEPMPCLNVHFALQQRILSLGLTT